MTIKLYTDGACSGNPGKGGWGAIIIYPNGDEKELSGGADLTTNNKMELKAAIEGLKFLSDQSLIEIFTDSKYVKDGINSWIISWKKTNWKNGKVKNIELWKELDQLNSKLNTNWNWVKGHSGDKYNDVADKLARNAIP